MTQRERVPGAYVFMYTTSDERVRASYLSGVLDLPTYRDRIMTRMSRASMNTDLESIVG